MNIVLDVEKVASRFGLIHDQPSKPFSTEISLWKQVAKFLKKFCFKNVWQHCTKLTDHGLEVPYFIGFRALPYLIDIDRVLKTQLALCGLSRKLR